MNKLLTLVLFSLTLFTTSFASFAFEEPLPEQPAQEAAPAEETKDWAWLVFTLKQYDIDSTRVDWIKINSACSTPGKRLAENVYNQCRLDKLLIGKDYDRDREQCWRKAELNVPDSMKNSNLKERKVITDEKGNKKTVDVYDVPLGKKVIEEKRELIFTDCMIFFGWKNPHNWNEGKRDGEVKSEVKG